MKNLYPFFTLALLIMLNACSSKSNPQPDNGQQNNNGGNQPVNTQPFVQDKSFAILAGSSSCAAIQPDGKIIIAGNFGANYSYQNKVYRLNANGGIDNTFNIDVDKTWIINSFSYVAIAADGKIIVAGDFNVNGVRKILLRLTANGALDNTFTSPVFNQIANISLTSINKLVFQTDGKILVAGHFNVFSGKDYNYFIRLQNNGALDASFRFDPAASSANSVSDIILLPNGKILASGYFVVGTGTNKRHVIARFNNDGSSDLSFNFVENIYSTITTSASGFIDHMALQPDGKIIIGGGFYGIETPNVRDSFYGYNRLARLTSDGAVDLSFQLKDGAGKDVSDIVILPDNRIFTAALASLNGPGSQSYIALYSKDGELNTSFNLGYQFSGVSQIIKQSETQYLLVGNFTDPSRLAIMRITKQ